MIPITNKYWLMLSSFLVQGLAAGVYDIAGNKLIFGLWKGKSTAPVNAMHAGFGIGTACEQCDTICQFEIRKERMITRTRIHKQ